MIRRSLLRTWCCGLLLWPVAAPAQWGSLNVDSLERLLNPHERSAEQLWRYNLLASNWLVSAKAMRYLPYVDTLSDHLLAGADGNLRMQLLHLRATYHYRMGYQLKFRRDVPGALQHFERCWALWDSLDLRPNASGAIEAIGVLYESVGENALAMQHYELALARQLESATPGHLQEGSARRHIASLFMNLGQFQKADSALAGCDTSIIDLRIIVNALRARKHLLQGDTAAAEAGYLHTIDLVDLSPNDWAKLDHYMALARLRRDHGDHRGAIDAATSCAAIAARTGDEAAWCTAMILAGRARHRLGDDRGAEHDLRAALDTARAYGYHGLARLTGNEGSMVEAASTLRLIYLDQGRLKEAMDMTAYWSRLKDTLNLRDGRLGVLRHRMRHAAQADSATAALALAKAHEAGALARVEAEHQRYRALGALALALALALVAFLLFRAMRQRQRLANKERELHNEQVDQLLSQQEMKSINAMLDGQEQERERVSKELHDHVGSLLGAIKHQLGVLEEQVADVKTEQNTQYKKVSGLLDNAAGELRRISHDMAAATLNRFGLEKALKDLRDTLHINGRLQVELNTFGLEQPLGRGIEIAVYRIIQEAVGNVLKHAKATELSIAVTHAPARLSALVSDNGTGFDPAAATDGMGLANIRSRTAALGAQLQIDSTPGKGTTVSVECTLVE